jgi:hypothetical protein
MAFLAIAIAGYSLSFLVRGLEAFGTGLRESFLERPWVALSHFTLGPVALLAGALNFRHAIRRARPTLHRRIGQLYVLTALGTGIVGGWLALHAQGGLPNRLGFGGLAFATLFTTIAAWRYATQRDFTRHRQWMLRSYAMILAAVTLRIELPLLALAFQAFEPAYAIIAWSCWVPNLLVAEWIARTTKRPA